MTPSPLGASRRVVVLAIVVIGCQGQVPSSDPPGAKNASRSKDRPATSSASGPLSDYPLQPRAAATGTTRFLRLAVRETGVDFVHRWDPPREHDREIANGLSGGGVALGDYDGDGRIDIFLTRPQGGCRLYRNLGQFRFQDVTQRVGLEDGSLWGTGATLADLDNDGDLDLYVCGFDCPNRLYVNQGDGTYVERAQLCGLAFRGASVMMSFADYDGDGDLDGYLLTNRMSPPERLQVKAVRRDGQWVVPEEIRQYKDLLIKPDGTPFPIDAGQYDHLFRNEGLGRDGLPRFQDVSAEARIQGNEFGLSATWWDFDDDGWPDLYVSNDFFGPDHLYRNNGNGTFSDVARFALPHTPWFSMGTDAADINNDGRLDFLATDMSGTSHFKQKVAMGEMGESGWFLNYPTPRQYMRNALYLNSGTGRCLEVAYLAGLADTNWTWSVNFADFDNDSRIDLFVSNGMTRDWFHSDLRNQVREIGDWNEGGRQFWLNTPELKERNLAFQNLGELNFVEVGAQWGLSDLSVSFGAAVADLDDDGALDLVVNDFEQPVRVYRNQSREGHSITVALRGTRSNRFGVGSTVRIKTIAGQQVRQAWLSHGYMSSSPPVLHFGLGSDPRVEQLDVQWPSGHRQTFRDLAADRHYVITEPKREPPPRTVPEIGPLMFARSKKVPAIIHQEDAFDDFADQPLLPNRLSRLGPGMAWGDANGDGQDDLYVGGAAGQPGTLLLRSGEIWVPSPQKRGSENGAGFAGDAACEDMGALWLDVERDGDLDLYVVSGGTVTANPASGTTVDPLADRLYLNDGRGLLRLAPRDSLPPDQDSGSVVAAADFDRDGDLDVLVGGRFVAGSYPETPRSRLLRNDSGEQVVRFTDATDQVAPALRETGLVTSALWSDVDQDGWIDLLVTHEWGPIKLFLNRQGRLVDATREAGLSDRTGWWNAITGADLDCDGDIDYVVTNFGLNTKYHASVEQPQRLFYGDVDGSGRNQILEAEYENGVLYPVRGKSCSTRAMPSLSERFPTFESFALASLEDIYSQSCLDQALQRSINTLESGCLINDGTGRFEFLPLPRLAQASPGFGVVATELDGDGYVDLFLAQNFFGPQPETGNFDGGVGILLRGGISAEGKPRWTPAWPDETGIVLAGDGASLTSADLNHDAWPDLVVAMNDGPVLAYEHRGREDRRVLQIRLQGKPGNRHATGARVRVQRDDGHVMTAEVYSGGGYLSQSSSDLVFGLGETGTVLQLDIHWPDGTTRQVRPHPQSRRLLIDERGVSSL